MFGVFAIEEPSSPVPALYATLLSTNVFLIRDTEVVDEGVRGRQVLLLLFANQLLVTALIELLVFQSQSCTVGS